ncbi:hypothetical protein ASG01_00715 [Chryseobacterium sp. Leaf180]|uniref:hypothetical protein n=1 Tax=Chryseobacterium sp. Leaf180 TaxID=1736289 RepID=UPI0006FFA642|nr:hypothetical protein [Chryseobacterium sp. Leaf180]KQR94443.1 hypothetical protein ASG01_00715 [Chryseobacterium sp. Leaf180]
MTEKGYKELDCSVLSFQFIKRESEEYWEQVNLDVFWGFQIQEGSKWKKGLSEPQLEDFQKNLGIAFSEPLKNYYRTMNGLDKPGINNNGGEGAIEFGTTFYRYPEDIERIKSQIKWIFEDNKVTDEIINTQNAPSIIPYLGHRFLILDNEGAILSMYGNDMIIWAENLSKGIARDIFPIHSAIEMKNINMNSFWNRKVR